MLYFESEVEVSHCICVFYTMSVKLYSRNSFAIMHAQTIPGIAAQAVSTSLDKIPFRFSSDSYGGNIIISEHAWS